jgi:hypothetical protein
VLLEDGDATIFLAGDTSYNEGLMLAGRVDGVGSDTLVSATTLAAIKRPPLSLAVYLRRKDHKDRHPKRVALD